MGRRARLCGSTEGPGLQPIGDDSVAYGGIDGCSGVLVLKNGVRCPKALEEGGLWSKAVVWKARQSDMLPDGGWQDGTLGSASLGMP